MSSPILQASDLQKVYGAGESRFHALRGVSLDIAEAETLAIVGPSGSGKSTLMHVLAALDKPDGGAVRFQGQDLGGLRQGELDALRNQEFGFVFQQFHLDEGASVLENVAMPLMVSRVPRRDRRGMVLAALERLGLSDRIDDRAGNLSGGQRQRVAIARAIVNRPRVLFADEPTGALDRENGDKVARLLFDLHEQDGLTLVMVTHSGDLAERCGRQVSILDGRLDPAAHTTLEGAR